MPVDEVAIPRPTGHVLAPTCERSPSHLVQTGWKTPAVRALGLPRLKGFHHQMLVEDPASGLGCGLVVLLSFLRKRNIAFSPTPALGRSARETLLARGWGEKMLMRNGGGEGAAEAAVGSSGGQAVPPSHPQRRTPTILQIRLMHLEYTGGKKTFSDSQKYYKKSRAGETHPALQ